MVWIQIQEMQMLMQFIEDISITDLLWILITEMQRKAQSE
jgi:hypothetical protein